MFPINYGMLETAHNRLKNRQNIYWLVGASCSGKSTISQFIADHSNITRFDMDAQIYGGFIEQYTMDRHPANKTWLSAPNPLAWQLGLNKEDFDAFNRAANVEHLDLFTADPAINKTKHPLLVDGGIIHPSLLIAVIPHDHIVCLDSSRADRVAMWEHSPERAPMKEWVCALPDPQAMWQKFLQCDEWIAQSSVQESETNDLKVFKRDRQTSIVELAQKVAAYLGLKLDFKTLD